MIRYFYYIFYIVTALPCIALLPYTYAVTTALHDIYSRFRYFTRAFCLLSHKPPVDLHSRTGQINGRENLIYGFLATTARQVSPKCVNPQCPREVSAGGVFNVTRSALVCFFFRYAIVSVCFWRSTIDTAHAVGMYMMLCCDLDRVGWMTTTTTGDD